MQIINRVRTDDQARTTKVVADDTVSVAVFDHVTRHMALAGVDESGMDLLMEILRGFLDSLPF